MAIVIEKIESKADRRVAAWVSHKKRLLHVFVDVSAGEVETGQEYFVEMAYDNVLEWRFIPSFQHVDSGIFGSLETDHPIRIVGCVHSLVQVGENNTIVDLYIQNGPEFLAITTQELGGVIPVIGQGMEVVVEGLCFYPTHV